MLISIGYGNFVWSPSILAILKPDSSPIRKLRQDAAQKGLLIDASNGRRTRGTIMMNTGHVILSALQPETLKARLDEQIRAQQKEKGELSKDF